MNTRICNKCKEEKPLTNEFFKTTRQYFESICKVCRNKQWLLAKQKRLENPEYVKQLTEKRKIYQKKHYVENNDWYKNRNIRLKQHYSEYKKLKRLSPEFKVKERERNKQRYTNPRYKISKNMSTKINSLIRDKNRTHVFKLLGYGVDDLLKHLESQFVDGMSWNNYGKWHIDHIRPICSFNYTSKNDAQFLECWSLSNLRPLWAIDNIKKSHRDRLLKVDIIEPPRITIM